MTPGATVLPLSRPRTVAELAECVKGLVEGDPSAQIIGASSIADAETGDIVFAENQRFLSQAEKSRASAIVAFLEATVPDKPLIKVENPRYAFARILELFAPKLNVCPGVHPTAVIGQEVRIGQEVSIGPHVVVGDNVTIGDRTVLLAGCYIGDYCVLREDCVLHPRVTLYHGTRIGKHVIIHSGTVIGADGFGYMRIGDECYKVPQIGMVEIGDDVEIGANCAIDRAKTGATVVGARTKIDNLVHIGHNVQIGSDCVIVAQVGIGGSSVLGRGVTLAGQAGLADHVRVGDGAVVYAQAGIIGKVPPGEHVSGYLAQPHRKRMRMEAEFVRLPEHVKRIRTLEKANSELKAQNERLERLVSALMEKVGLQDTE